VYVDRDRRVRTLPVARRRLDPAVDLPLDPALLGERDLAVVGAVAAPGGLVRSVLRAGGAAGRLLRSRELGVRLLVGSVIAAVAATASRVALSVRRCIESSPRLDAGRPA